MFNHTPGSKAWWQETALICAGGVALAVWLWDGPVPVPAPAATAPLAPPPTLAQMLDAGCLTQRDLQALRENRPVTPSCPVLLRDLPPNQRPFP